ncbi:hypothetical protein CC78DRAFT_608618 [Lojkania enalia]|uniref:Probable beta-glucosidase G n=1 Tax=Lojkania enalia TaxID=147567 RepID=A0A9P4N0D5_9PLEO|nr:hypothetical protein CC78DRAFT_608618 [Didymosphaeria enalia]
MHFLGARCFVPIIALLQFTLGAALPRRSPYSWFNASEKAVYFVSQLNNTEKIGLVTGSYSSPNLPCVGTIGAIKRLGFKGLCLSDGPSGYARSDGTSVFPSGITTAATWDKSLMYDRAVALGVEFRAKGAHVHLGPSTGPMGRNARGGRNWEGFGPDPYLAGVAINASVLGIQSVGVQACSKHYVGNEQETQRTSTVVSNGIVVEAISSNIDDRTLHELYVWPFANAVQAGTSAVMCAYNRVNGSYSCASSDILNILKDELAFAGYVMSDWYATHSTVDSANAGLDMEMPGNVSIVAGPSYFGTLLLEAINDAFVSEDRLDDMAKRVMTPYFLLGQDEDYPSVDPASGGLFLTYQYGHGSSMPSIYAEVNARDVRADHAKIIREVGAAGTVLLKNVNGTLPLTNETNIGLFGNDVPYPAIGSAFLDIGQQTEGFEMVTLDIGGGSGTARHTSLVTPFKAIQDHVDSLGGRVQPLFDNEKVAEGLFRTIYPTPDACLIFLKAFATEGHDRLSLDLQWNATMAVESTAAMCSNTIVITHGPGVTLMPWADNENVTAILAAHYPGEESGNSIVDILWGDVEPSGRLPYTIPKTASDYGPPIVESVEMETDPNAWQVDFVEGQLIDYRHFDANGIEPLYDFGFGLSYTTFRMEDSLNVNVVGGPLPALADESKGIAPGGLKDLWNTVAVVTVEVTNSGHRSGYAVPQLYISLPQSTTPKGTPLKVLRGFEKIRLKAGETKRVKFELMRRDLSYWGVDEKQWVIPAGCIQFMAGFSSRDLRSKAAVVLLE